MMLHSDVDLDDCSKRHGMTIPVSELQDCSAKSRAPHSLPDKGRHTCISCLQQAS